MAAPLSAVHRHRRVRTDIALACLAIIGLVAWTSIALAPVNVDVAWLLVACGRLLDGSVLHRDVIEVNPPFSIWLYMPFVVAERATSIAASTWLAIELPTLALASVLLSGRILTRGTAFDRPVSAWAIPASLVILSGLSPADFGQREQFAAIAILPWGAGDGPPAAPGGITPGGPAPSHPPPARPTHPAARSRPTPLIMKLTALGAPFVPANFMINGVGAGRGVGVRGGGRLGRRRPGGTTPRPPVPPGRR